MAQDGDTITYVYNSNLDNDSYLIPQTEDISNVNEATVEYCDGAGAGGTEAASGGRVENATIDLSGQDTLYIWVAGGVGRYEGSLNGVLDSAGGSTEVAFVNTDARDSSDEPFLIGAGGGGTGYVNSSFFTGSGARGDGNGVAPPAGGDGGTSSDTAGEAGDGAVDDQNRGLVSGGTTIKGGGSPADTDGEVRISYKALTPPDPPSNLSAEVQ